MLNMANVKESDSLNNVKTIILSILLVIGIISNLISLKIISRRKFRKNPINKYLWCLTIIDILTIVGYMPMLFITESCRQPSYFKAVYKAFVKSNLVYYGKYLTTYILLNLTIDRLLGIVKNTWYKNVIRYSNTRIFVL